MSGAEKGQLNRARMRTAHGAEKPAVHVEPGEALHLLVRQHVGDAPRALDEVRAGLQPGVVHQKREGLEASVQRDLHDQPRLCDEHALFGLELASQLAVGEPNVGVKARVLGALNAYDLRVHVRGPPRNDLGQPLRAGWRKARTAFEAFLVASA